MYNIVFLLNHIDAQHVTERSFCIEIIVSFSRLEPHGATCIYRHGGRDSVLVIFRGKIRSCEKSAGPVNCSVHRTCCLVMLVNHVMKIKQSVTCVQLYTVFYSVLFMYYIELILP